MEATDARVDEMTAGRRRVVALGLAALGAPLLGAADGEARVIIRKHPRRRRRSHSHSTPGAPGTPGKPGASVPGTPGSSGGSVPGSPGQPGS